MPSPEQDAGQGPVRRPGFPFSFRCRRSGNCCARPEGFVRVTPEDVQEIAAHLGLSEAGFRSRFLAPGGLLKQGLGNRCVFLAEGRKAVCTIYPVRPERCRTWPFWQENIGSEEALLAAAALCPGIRLDPEPPSGS